MVNWLDREIERQKEIQGPEIIRLISDAAKAEELFSLDELEEFAACMRAPEEP